MKKTLGLFKFLLSYYALFQIIHAIVLVLFLFNTEASFAKYYAFIEDGGGLLKVLIGWSIVDLILSILSIFVVVGYFYGNSLSEKMLIALVSFSLYSAILFLSINLVLGMLYVLPALLFLSMLGFLPVIILAFKLFASIKVING